MAVFTGKGELTLERTKYYCNQPNIYKNNFHENV